MNKKTSVYGAGLKVVENEKATEEKIIVTESPTVEQVTEDLAEKGDYPPELFEDNVEQENPGEILEKLGKPVVEDAYLKSLEAKPKKVSNTIDLVVPNYKPWKGSGRLVVQAFNVEIITETGIELVRPADSKTISPNTELIIVGKDPDIKGIQFGDKVKFAADFVPTEMWIGSIKYFVPHWQDVLLVNASDTDILNIQKTLMSRGIENKNKK